MNKSNGGFHRSKFVSRIPFGSEQLGFMISHHKVVVLSKNYSIVYSANDLSCVESYLSLGDIKDEKGLICEFSRHVDYRAAKSRFARDITSYKRLAACLWTAYGCGVAYNVYCAPRGFGLVKKQTRCWSFDHSLACNKTGLITPSQ